MPATYPTSIVAFTTKTNKVDIVDASHINRLQEEVVAEQTELGKIPKGTATNLTARLAKILSDSGAVRQGTSFPGTTEAGLLFFRTDSDTLYKRNAANTAWDAIVTNVDNEYYEEDSTCVLAFDNGESAFDLTLFKNVITLTNLDYTKFAAGKVSNQCYNFDGTTDYAAVTANALWNGMSKFTLEVWLYRDTSAADMYFFDDAVGNDFIAFMSNTNFSFSSDFVTTGQVTINKAHGLASNGTGQWIYLVITADGANLTMYVNGVSVGTQAAVGNTQNINAITIGALAGGTEAWDGKIDGVRLLRNQVWDATAILARYNSFA